MESIATATASVTTETETSSTSSSSTLPLEESVSQSTVNQFMSMMQLDWLNSLIIQYTANWSTVAFFIMRPETFAFVVAIFIIFAVTHNFETVSALVTSRLSKSQWFKLLKLSSRDASIKSDVISVLFTSGLNDVYELKAAPKVAIFGIRGRRGKMEDKFDYINEINSLGIEMYAIFDGHGSDKAANFVSKNLLTSIRNRIEKLLKDDDSTCFAKSFQESFCEKFKKTTSSDTSNTFSNFLTMLSDNKKLLAEVPGIIRQEILAIDKELVKLGKQDPDFGGTTAVIAVRLYNSNKLFVANVGDSRGVLCNSRGMAVPLSHDHKPQNPPEHKRIRAAGGFIKFTGVWRVAGILATSRALGDSSLKEKNYITAEPDTLTFDLTEHQPQFLIIASDGLWDTFSNEDAVRFVRDFINSALKKGSISPDEIAYQASKALVYEAYKRLSLDNVTVIIVIFDPKEFNSTLSLAMYKKKYASLQL